MDQDKYAVPALENGLDIIEIFARAREGISQKEVANLLGKSAGSTFRLLHCLEKRGYIYRNSSTNRYYLTLKIYAMAQENPIPPRIELLAAAPLRELAQRVSESCHLSMLEGTQIRTIYNQNSPHRHSLNVSAGDCQSSLETASGRLILAHMPAEEMEAIVVVESRNIGWDDARRQSFLEELEQVRLHRHIIAESRVTPGVLDANLLLRGRWGGHYLTIAVPCLQKWSAADQERILLPSIYETGESIEHALAESQGETPPHA